jgi:L-threonylcarbamoyladenylate synthase
MTDRLPADGDGIRIAVEILRRGGLVAFPTDTVHGVACRGDDDRALTRLFELKGRPAERRVAWLVSDLDQARALGLIVDERADRLAGSFWPGGLTLVLEAGDAAPAAVRPTLGVRAPDHPVAQQLLAAAGPLPTTSANPPGFPDTTSADDVLVAFAGQRLLDAVIEGESSGGVASSVLDLTSEPARLLREGAVSRAALEEMIGPID